MSPPPGELSRVGTLRAPGSVWSSAARWIARRIAPYVPHLHTLPDIAASMSASVGLSLVANSATADMICSDWQ